MIHRTMGKSNHIETRYLSQEEFARWDQLVALSEDGTIFQTSAWLQAFAKWQNLTFRIAGCFKGDQLTGGMAFTCKKKFGWIRVMQIPYKTSFYGPVLAKTETKYISKKESHHQGIIEFEDTGDGFPLIFHHIGLGSIFFSQGKDKCDEIFPRSIMQVQFLPLKGLLLRGQIEIIIGFGLEVLIGNDHESKSTAGRIAATFAQLGLGQLDHGTD